MPSSTFSSEPWIPAGRWGATWLLALVLAAVVVWRLELVTRAGGQRPSVVDDPVLWSLARIQVDADPGIVAFVGTSRMALAYSAPEFARAAPELRGLQLSITDHQAFGVLADLAADDAFRGVVVFDLLEPDVIDPEFFHQSDPYVRRGHALWRSPGSLVNRYAASQLQSRLAVLAVGGRRIITALVGKRQWPAPQWVAIDRQRSSHADYRLATPAALRAKADRRLPYYAPTTTPDAWLGILEREVEPLVRRIQARGGDVVVLRMPISGRLAARVDEAYPRSRYWDVFAARTAARAIHAGDVPALANLLCPDEMHLDQRDQAAFTRAVVEALRARGVLRGRGRAAP